MRHFEEQRQALHPAAQHLLDTRVLEADMPPRQWIEMLTPLAALDEQADAETIALKQRRSPFRWFGWIILIAAVVLVFVVPIAGVAAIAVGIGLLVVATTYTRKIRQVDAFSVPDHLKETILPVVIALNEDASRHSSLKLSIDLNPTESAQTVVRQGQIALANWRKCTETVCAKRWIAASMTLADASRVSFAVDDIVRTRSGTKRGSSGKIKHKTKKMRWVVVMAQTVLPTDHWRLLDQPRHRTQYRLKVKRGEKRTTITAKAKTKTPDLRRIPPPQLILAAISEGHRCVEPVRAEAGR